MHSAKIILPLLIVLLQLCTIQGLAQKDYMLMLEHTKVVPIQNVDKFNIHEVSWQAHIHKEQLYGILQFHELPSFSLQEKIKNSGILLLDYLPNKAYTASLPLSITRGQLEAMNVRAILPMQAAWKLSEDLGGDELPDEIIVNGEIELLVTLQKNETKEKVEKELSIYGTILRPRHHIRTSQIVYLKIAAKKEQVLALAALPFVSYIQVKPSEPRTLTDDTRASHRANVLTSTSIGGLSLSGAGVVIGVGDAGTINEHIDLDSRILNAYNIDENSHGAKVTGIIVGEGILSPTSQGFAPEAEVVADIFTNSINNISNYYNNLGMVLTNNSYGSNLTPFCTNAGTYNGSSRAMDQIANTELNVLHCLAAGNDGNDTCSPYPAGFGTVFQGLQSAKNVMTIGSVDAYNVIAHNSSRGPTKDGRIKPEIVGVGVNVSSPNMSNSYSIGSGTSFSTPSVTGTFALLWEHYRNENAGADPPAALMKAIACNTADDLGNPGPDYIYGYGRINGLRASNVISSNDYLSNGVRNGWMASHNIIVPANTAEIRVLLYWQDEEAAANANPVLVNDLDMSVDVPGGSTYLPWVLDDTPANVQNNAVRGVDSQNNIEQVTIEAPSAGTYTANIVGTSVPIGLQTYYLIYEIIPKHVQITYPTGGEIFAPDEEILITWDAGGYDTQAFTIAYSLNDGASWTNISTNVPGDARQYSFTTPTAISTTALIRVSRNGTSLTSTNYTVFNILDVPTNIVATPDCDGSIDLNWAGVSGGLGYIVYENQVGAWVQVGVTNTTNFNLAGRTAGELYCYTVQPTYPGGVLGRRAIGECVVAFGTSVAAMPYYENFESSDGAWFTRGKNTDWTWGSPNGVMINSAASGIKAWATDLSGDYANASEAYLYSPCFDLSGMTSPALSFSLIYKIEDNGSNPSNPFDVAKVEYSLNGKAWSRLGVNGGGSNWYSNTAGLHHWDGQNPIWHTASYDIPSTSSRVQFRLLIDADQYSSEEGIGIDDICIGESGESCALTLLELKTMLKGNYDMGSGLMKDDLRQNNFIPLTEPYTSIGYTHVGGGGGETIAASVLITPGNDAIVDWVVLELRSGTDPTTIIATRSVLLQADGDVVDTDGTSPVAILNIPSGSYYVAIRHRNHLGTMTAMPIFIIP